MNNLATNNESDILQRIKLVRSGSEPAEPTEETESLEIKPDETEIEEAEELPEAITDLEQTAELDDEPEETQDKEDLYIDLDGEEVSFSQINEWKHGNLRQSDYTRKTQALADDRKAIESERENITSKAAELDDKIAQLNVFIDEFNTNDFDGMTLDELREDDPGEYLKVTEQQAKRKQALAEAKKLRSSDTAQATQEQARSELEKLVTLNPNWIKDGKETKQYQSDMTIVKSYLDDLGVPEQAQQGILTTGHGQAYIDAAKYHASKKSNASITKKVRKAPTVTKPSGASKSQAAKQLDAAIANHKKHGTTKTAFALRKAQQNFNR